jgi:hypothetical protein
MAASQGRKQEREKREMDRPYGVERAVGSRLVRAFMALGLLSVLAACAGHPGETVSMPVEEEAARYRAHARAYYVPPGPPEDPWGPYIHEASQRFDVPETWVRAVIVQESGGRLFHNGQLVTSGPGAMGLMQLMPPTYDEMRAAYGLGDDAYEPHDNIMAGTGYIRQLYDIYGSPGFLAAYNAGPGRLEDFLTRNRTLPRETRNYVASIGRRIVGVSPANRSQADLLVASHDPMARAAARAAGARSTHEISAVQTAWSHKGMVEQPVQVADVIGNDTAADEAVSSSAAPDSAAAVRAAWASRMASSQGGAPARRQVAQLTGAGSAADQTARQDDMTAEAPSSSKSAAPGSASSGVVGHTLHFGLFPAAQAEPVPLMTRQARDSGTRNWAIQVGAFGSAAQAQQATGQARQRAQALLAQARPQVAPVSGHGGKLYRARLVNLSHIQAQDACRRLSSCVVISPGSRS